MKALLLIPALVAVAAVYAVFDTESGAMTLLHVRRNVAESAARIETIRREIAALERDAAALESDAFAIESAIREDLDLVRPGERLVRFAGPQDSNPRFP